MFNITPPVHPGEILREEFLVPYGLTPYALAKMIKVPRTRVERLAREEAPVTTDTALRLGKVFGTSPNFWLNLQTVFDLTVEEEAKKADIEAIEPYATMAA